MTTNGSGLARLAPALAAAGLMRVNISCDSLHPDRFAAIRRRGVLPTVLEAMEAAEEAGLAPVKVNVVVMAGVNDDEIIDLAGFARDTGRVVRFIEFMPLDADETWERSKVVPGEEILARISQVWPLEPASERSTDAAPADRYRFVDGRGEIGVITSVTRAFCGSCNRLRLTADGAIRNCLFANGEHPVRDILRARRQRCGPRPAASPSRVGQAGRARDQRPVLPAPGEVDVDDRRLKAARGDDQMRRAGSDLSADT